jgi:poly(rC)-binding protein 2/3/4
MSASQIKIMEPGATAVGVNGAPAPTGGEGERLVVITGQPHNIQMAVQLLYHVGVSSPQLHFFIFPVNLHRQRLEQEKQKQLRQQPS